MRRSITLVPLTALTLLAAAPAVPADPDGPTAHAARTCSLTRYQAEHLGTTYVRSLRQHGTKCRHARKLVKAFNSCRKDNGGRDGRCIDRDRTYDYDCNEDRYEVGLTQYRSKVRCLKGDREVSWKYVQNTG